MKKKLLIVALINILVIFLGCRELSDFPVLKGPYLGQTSPGMVPVIFAPGIISTGQHEHSSPVFTPDLKEIYWNTIIRENGVTISRTAFCMKQLNGVWSRPQVPSFAKIYPCYENPFITNDGKRLFFAASKSLSQLDFKLYYVDRIGNEWSKPVIMEYPFNEPGAMQWQLTIADNGNIYFVGHNEKSRSKCGIYYSKFENGKYQKPVLMEEFATDFSPYIAPDESYIIFNSWREDQFGKGDLYISFKKNNGSWCEAINMGSNINTEYEERFPNVSPDGRYLFFNRSQKIMEADPNGPGNGYGDVYWVDADVINELKPDELK